MESDERSPGQGRYAHEEREQRWLLTAVPAGVREPVEIVDRYIERSRLRLRRVDGPGRSVFKLGQKVRRGDTPEVVMLTNLYLSEDEFEVLRALPARELRKRRWQLHVDGRRFAVDELHGPLEGMILAEIELNVDEPLLDLPPFEATEVTWDDRFSGGRLAGASVVEVADLLGGPPQT